jgi:polyisoprenoid-binding protein YceI
MTPRPRMYPASDRNTDDPLARARRHRLRPAGVRSNYLPLLFWLLVGTAPAPAAEFHVDTAAANDVRFLSDAPIEDFEGVTRRIDGYVLWEGDSLVAGQECDGSELYFEVDLADLDTGIKLRNQHMREHYLETGKYPYAFFQGKIVQVDSLPGRGWHVRATGKLAIHGAERDYDVACEVVREVAGYRFTTGFPIRLPDFNIKIPSLMFMKISENIDLNLDVHIRRAEAPGPEEDQR